MNNIIKLSNEILTSENIDNELKKCGYTVIAGIDEAGRGCSAGNVVAACVILPDDFYLEEITDSKKVSKKKHPVLAQLIKENAIAYGIGEVEPSVIDEINILEATKLAMKMAVDDLLSKNTMLPNIILIDGNFPIDVTFPQSSIVKGDKLSFTISCASILAKNHKDEHMKMLDKELNYKYNWSSNSGYQTQDHLEAIKKYGISKYHRKSYKTFKKLGLM